MKDMSLLQREFFRKRVTAPLAVMMIFTLLFGFLAEARQANAASCASISSQISVTFIDKTAKTSTIDIVDVDRSAAALYDNTSRKAPAPNKGACCDLYCSASFVLAEMAVVTRAVVRQAVRVPSDQSPETRAVDGLKRPPKTLLKI